MLSSLPFMVLALVSFAGLGHPFGESLSESSASRYGTTPLVEREKGITYTEREREKAIKTPSRDKLIEMCVSVDFL